MPYFSSFYVWEERVNLWGYKQMLGQVSDLRFIMGSGVEALG